VPVVYHWGEVGVGFGLEDAAAQRGGFWRGHVGVCPVKKLLAVGHSAVFHGGLRQRQRGHTPGHPANFGARRNAGPGGFGERHFRQRQQRIGRFRVGPGRQPHRRRALGRGGRGGDAGHRGLGAVEVEGADGAGFWGEE